MRFLREDGDNTEVGTGLRLPSLASVLVDESLSASLNHCDARSSSTPRDRTRHTAPGWWTKVVLASVVLGVFTSSGCSWAVSRPAEIDGRFQRHCTYSRNNAVTDTVFASLSGAAALALLITGGVVLAGSDDGEGGTGEGGVVAGVLMGFSAAPLLAGAIWAPSASYGFRNASRCTELRAIDAGCRAAPECVSDGLCSYDGTRCVALEAADCVRSRGCRSSGRCVLEGGACVAAVPGKPPIGNLPDPPTAVTPPPPAPVRTDDQCRAGVTCRELGLCGAREGSCIAVSDDDCRRALRCRAHGRCSLSGGQCVAATDADCQASDGCTSGGLCAARDGICAEAR